MRPRRSRRPQVQRFGLPAVPPRTEDEMYAHLVSWGGLVVAAEAGVTTEITRPDGRVAARLVPARESSPRLPRLRAEYPVLLLTAETIALAVFLTPACWLIARLVIWLVLS